MSTIVCNKDCQYRKAVFCGKDFVMLNQFGQCSEWFAKNGQPKVIFDFNRQPTSNPSADADSMDPTEQKQPDTQLSEGKIQTEENDEKGENNEKFFG